MEQLTDLLLSILTIFIWFVRVSIYIVIGLFFSWILFKLKDPIIQTLDRIIELLSIKSSLFYNNFKDFNKKYIKEPWASVRLYLHNNKIYEYKSKIGQLTSTYIQKAQNLNSRSESLDNDFNNKYESIDQNIDSLKSNQNQINFETIINKATKHPRNLGTLIFYLLLTSLMVSINVLILGLFFQDVSPGLKEPITFGSPIVYAHLVSLMFALIEVGTGVYSYNASQDIKENPTDTDISGKMPIIWFTISVLALVEFIAFAVISIQIGMPAILNIDQGNALYHVVNLFMAFFGVAVTAFEYIMGHGISKAFHRLRIYNKDVKPLKSLKKKYDKLDSDLSNYNNQYGRLGKLISDCKVYIGSVSDNLQKGLNFNKNYPTPGDLVTIKEDQSVEESVQYIIKMPDNISVTTNETYSYILVNSFFAFIWGFLFYVTTTIMHSIIESMKNEAFLIPIGGFTVYAYLIAVVLSVAGYFIQISLKGDTYVDEQNKSNPTKSTKIYTYIAGIAIIVLISSFSVYGTSTIQDSNLIAIALGLLTPISLYLISFYINRYFFSLMLIIKTLGLFIISVLFIWSFSAISFLLSIISAIVKYVYELLASPGLIVSNKFQNKNKKIVTE